MSRTFKQLWTEVAGTIPNLPVQLAKNYVNRAWSDIRESRHWSFLQSEGILFSSNQITTGTFNVTQFSATVIANAAARAALDGLSNPIITSRQIRFNNGPIYEIASIDASFAANGIMTLTRMYREASNSAINYSVYRAYYGYPINSSGVESNDFLRYNTIYNPTIPYFFNGINLPSYSLDKRDPQRRSFNNPRYLYQYKSDANGNPQFEMWPHIQTAQAFIVQYQRRGTDFTSDNETLPQVITDQLLLEKALSYGCGWAMKNQSKFKELQGINWRLAKNEHDKTYSNLSSGDPGLLEIAHRNDEEIFPQSLINTNNHYQYPLGTDDMTGFYSIDPG